MEAYDHASSCLPFHQGPRQTLPIRLPPNYFWGLRLCQNGIPKSKVQGVGTERIVQSVKCFPHKHEDLGFISRSHMEKLDMVVLVCDPSVGKAATRGFLGLPGLSTWPNQGRPGSARELMSK